MEIGSAIAPDILDSVSQIGIDDYICCICLLIPYPETALEEENCGNLFCKACINSWMKKSNSCPICKSVISTRVIKDKNKIVYRHLINLVIKCQVENCDWKGVYKDYLEHLKINKHTKKKEINPGKLGKELVKSNTSNSSSLINSNNFDLYKYYKSTTHEHPLKYLNITIDNKWRCNCYISSGGCPNINKKRFRCMQCNYDLCDKCMIKYYDKNYKIKNDTSNDRYLYLFKKSYYTTIHKHPLIFLERSENSGWACDGRKFGKKCFSGITDFNQTKGIPRFRCNQCDFDLCENCMDHYRIKNNYERNKSYKVKCHFHPLVYIGVSNSKKWVCNKILEEKCYSGGFRQTYDLERFRCDECNFDLCIYCMDFYLKDNGGCIIF